MAEVKPPPMPPRTREILRVIYVFRQKYQHPVNTVEWWQRCCEEMSAISQHFGNDAFCNDLLVVQRRPRERQSARSAHEDGMLAEWQRIVNEMDEED